MPKIEITTTYDAGRGMYGAVAKGFEYIRVYCDTAEEAEETLRDQIKGYHDENERRKQRR